MDEPARRRDARHPMPERTPLPLLSPAEWVARLVLALGIMLVGGALYWLVRLARPLLIAGCLFLL